MSTEITRAAGSITSTNDMMRRVLLVDVEPLVLQVMKSTLDRNGFEVDTALNVEVAAELFEQNGHDVLVFGGQANEVLADQFCNGLTNLPTEQQPLILLASESGSSTAFSRSGTAYETLEKPLSLRYLVARLAGHFGCYSENSLAA